VENSKIAEYQRIRDPAFYLPENRTDIGNGNIHNVHKIGFHYLHCQLYIRCLRAKGTDAVYYLWELLLLFWKFIRD